MRFVDRARVHVKGGRGGNGVTAFARQPYEPRGRPEGGDGGHGGSVVVRASADVATLVDYHHRPHRFADRGRHGEGGLRRGSDGADTVLVVPVGTVVRDEDGTVLADLAHEGAQVVAAAGGRGGRGNAAFKNAQRRAPRFHELGEPGQERWITLEFKLVADVALVGYPNAGKSSLVARLSAAKPKIADYPFTTLTPHLGVVRVGAGGGASDDGLDFVVADVPGLIEGAAEGRGLGHDFLRHVQRAGVLVHVLDCATYGQRDPRADLRALLGELDAYDRATAGDRPIGLAPLLERPALVWLNKIDADPDTAALVRPDLEAEGWEVLAGSAVTGEGLDRLRWRLAALVRDARARAHATGATAGPDRRPVLRPVGAEPDFAVEVTPQGYRVTGGRVERWVAMTDLDNEEAVRYLQGRLARAGVEHALARAGARRGDDVEIGGTVFEFAPEPGMLPDDPPADAPSP